MKRFFLYTTIWAPGALVVFGFLLSAVTDRKIATGKMTYMEGYYTLLPWVWIPCFLLLPAFILGIILLISKKWMGLLQLTASVGLVFAWVSFVDSGKVLKHPTKSEGMDANRP